MMWNRTSSRARLAQHKMQEVFLAGCIPILAAMLLATGPSTHGAGAQVSFGNYLENLAAHKRYIDLDTALSAPTQDTPAVRVYRGFLADHQNDLARCITLLEPLASPREIAHLSGIDSYYCLRTLADAYFKSYRYADDAATLALMLHDSRVLVSASERQDAQNDWDVARALAGSPLQTTLLAGSFTLTPTKNALGLSVVPATADDVAGSWILDTGANLSTLSRSAAKQLGLKLSENTVQVTGADGSSVTAHTAVIPELRIGSAVIDNTPAVVIDDQALYIPALHFQISRVIGYPALCSLGSITFHTNGDLTFDSADPASDGSGARMFMDGFSPIVALTDASTYRLCTFDSGAPDTVFYDNYYKAHRGEFAGLSAVSIPIGGVGGAKSIPAYLPDRTSLTFGSTTVTLGRLAVLTQPHDAQPELFYGNLGQDVMRAAQSCTLDFSTMRFYVTADASTAK